MRYSTVCSGIEAPTVAWHQLGWEPVFFSEIEPFPIAVLDHHYPDVPNLGDMTKFKEWADYELDLICGGTPCQAFSVAGLRKGLADPRGNLALVYLALLDRYRPRWVVWENVPGVLSSNGGRDFGAFLGGLGQLGYHAAWRVLDAQYFGVPQRRRRVFVVGHHRDWRRAAAVLLERNCLGSNPSACGMERKKDAEICSFQDTRLMKKKQLGPGLGLKGIAYTLTSIGIQGIATLNIPARLFTPRECERLQGFPDDYTLINYRSRLAADGPRYKALGNSMAVPVMRWIGRRIDEVDKAPHF